MAEDNLDLFEEEIEEIREFSELDMDTFHDVLECTRGVVGGLGNSISPVMVVDVIESAVGNLLYVPTHGEEPITVEEAVERAVSNLHLADEMDVMFDEGIATASDDIATGKIRQ